VRINNIFDHNFGKLDHLDLELLIASAIKKTREFVMTHSDFSVNKEQESKINKLIKRRLKNEPMAYILGQKEFYGLNFKVNKHTLIPRPETELLVEKALHKIQDTRNPIKPNGHGANMKKTIIDIGTGSGNIIISIAKCLRNNDLRLRNYEFYGIDISSKALKVAEQNAKLHSVEKRIKFIRSDLLNYFLKSKSYKLKTKNLIILANLPYLSQNLYNAAMPDVKNYEPKTALLSGQDGLDHYQKLLQQIKKIKAKRFMFHVSCFMEISPEQKGRIQKTIKSLFPETRVKFYRDLANKWRVCEINL